MPAPDHAVRELAVARPRLRSDLRFTYQDHRGQPSYILEDLTHRRYFQIGLPEYQFLRGLDGKHSAREVIARNAREFGQKALTEHDASVLMRWLLDQKLLETESAEQGSRRYQHTSELAAKKKKISLQKLFFMRIPLGNPDRFLSAVLPFFAWTITVPFFILWLVVFCYGAFQLAQNWTPFMKASTAAVLPQNWLALGVIFIVLKLIHELWHGIVTKKYGGVVPEWGVMMLCFITPLTYIDASASWRFPSRWKRINVAGAGMYIELFLAAIAVIIWTRTEPGMVNTMAHNAVFAASTITLLFNANPLMRFDGYYILCDLIRIPNLGTKGQQFMQWLFRKIFFDVKKLQLPAQVREHLGAVATYGILAMLWRCVIWIGIMIMASLLFKGAGLFLVILSIVVGIVTLIVKMTKFLFVGDGGLRPNMGRSLMRIGLIFAGLAAIFTFVKINPSPKAVAVVEYPEKAILRAELAGFVREVHVENGKRVEEGELLALLENPDKEKELEQLKVDIEHSKLRSRKYFQEDRISAYQAELENLKGLQQRHAVLSQLVDSLTVKAPRDGIVHGDDLESLPGRYVQPGREIVTIIPEEPPRLLISAKQEDGKAMAGHEGEKLRAKLRGHPGAIAATLERVENQATTAVPHHALASTGGGPLLIRQRASMASERERGLANQNLPQSEDLLHFSGLEADRDPLANQQLVRARFAAYAQLAEDVMTENLREGEWGYAKLANVDEQPLGEWLYNKIAVYVQRRWEQARSVGA